MFSLGRTLRERTIVPLAVVPRFYLFFLAVKIREQRMLSMLASFGKLSGDRFAFPQSVRPLRCFSGKRIFNLSNIKKKPLFWEDRPHFIERVSMYIQYTMDDGPALPTNGST
jgi:hypothetical protein